MPPKLGLKSHLEEFHLIQCSLLPDEHLTFLDDNDEWLHAVSNPEGDHTLPGDGEVPTIEIRIDCINLWFEIYITGDSLSVSVKGENMSRGDQEKWQDAVALIREAIEPENNYPIYELVSLNLLPALREEYQTRTAQPQQVPVVSSSDERLFHVLLTSHHLVSPSKRRSLQQWSTSLSVSGFAKVGYPGVIYAEGERTDLEEFVSNVKGMQWLALKVRFMEPLPMQLVKDGGIEGGRKATWRELQKVGEVVEAMRGLGREEFIMAMGIGSSGS